jgi:septum site-determining protein MinC
MDSANLALALDSIHEELSSSAALLRGTSRGLEIVLQARASADAMVAALATRLDEAPAFFRGSDVRVAVEDGPLPAGCLARIDELAVRFGLRIIEVAALRPKLRERDGVPMPNLAAGSAPSPASDFEEESPTHSGIAAAAPLPPVLAATQASQPVVLAESELTTAVALDEPAELSFEEPTQTAIPLQLAPSPEVELETLGDGPRLVIGPVRSGVILEHVGHVIVFGDVNPGAELRASGNIVVLGRMRGTAHAGIGQDVGFILALRLEPQQLRIGRMVARAADSDTPPTEAEIAHVTGEQIVVERYTGKLPRNLATSL